MSVHYEVVSLVLAALLIRFVVARVDLVHQKLESG